MNRALLYKILANNTGAEISASGNLVTLSGALADNPLKECKIYGWSKQESTTGKNLFDFSRLISDGVNTMDYDKQTITVPANTNNTGYNQTLRDLCPGITPGIYVFSTKKSNQESISGSYFLEISKDFPVNTPIELTDAHLDSHISWYNNPDSEIENVISEIQLEAGDTVTAYEPYTGGQPSPSPEYPQEIISAGMKWSTGAQLYDMDTRLNVEGIEYEKEGTSYTVNIIKMSGSLLYGVPFQFSKEDVDATLSVSEFFNLEKAYVRINLLDSEGKTVGTLWADKTKKELSAKCSKIRFDWSSGGKFIVSDLMLNFGNTALPYEPYTGGVPKLYGDKVNVEVHGKNLFDLEYAKSLKNWTLGSNGYYYIPYYVGNGNVVTVTYESELQQGLGAYICLNKTAGQTDGVYGWLYHSGSQKLINNKIVLVSNADYLYINAAGKVIDVLKEMTNFQIEVSPSPTAYEPYHEPQSLSIQTPNGLLAIPVETGRNYTDANGQQWVADYIDLKRGKYVQRVWQKTFDGSESWETYMSTGYYLANILPEKMSNREMLCNQLRRSDGGIASDVAIVGAFGTDSTIYIDNSTLKDNTQADKGLSNWKAHLAEHPLTVMTYLDEPIGRDLTPSEVQAYQELVTYAGTTILENDADCYMEVSAGGGDALRAKKLALILGD